MQKIFVYPATLTNSLMSFSTSLVASLRVSMYSIMPSANSEYFTASFQFGFLLFFSYYVGRTTKIMLNNSDKNDKHPFLVPVLRRNGFSFAPLRMMFAMVLLFMAFIMLRSVSSMPTV